MTEPEPKIKELLFDLTEKTKKEKINGLTVHLVINIIWI